MTAHQVMNIQRGLVITVGYKYPPYCRTTLIQKSFLIYIVVEWFECVNQASEIFKYFQESTENPFAYRIRLFFGSRVRGCIWNLLNASELWGGGGFFACDSFLSIIILISSVSFLLKFMIIQINVIMWRYRIRDCIDCVSHTFIF